MRSEQNLACPAGAQEGRHLRFPPSCESPLSLGESGANQRSATASKRRTAEDFSSATDGLPSESILLSSLFAVSDTLLLHISEGLRRRNMTVLRNSLARCNGRHLRIRRSAAFILVDPVCNNALTNCAALSCRALRRVKRLCSSTLSVNCEKAEKDTLR